MHSLRLDQFVFDIIINSLLIGFFLTVGILLAVGCVSWVFHIVDKIKK